MPIPDYQRLMRPLLEHLSDGAEHTSEETSTILANLFHLSEQERTQLQPTGKGTVFGNRIAWAKARLKQAGMIDSPRSGVYQIVPSGTVLLQQTTGPITLKELDLVKHGGLEITDEPSPEAMTPDEQIEHAHKQIRQKLAVDLLEQIKACSPTFFEELVVRLIFKMGYGGSEADAKRVGRSGDGGIDGTIKLDSLGLETVYIQAKRWEGVVGSPEIHKFAGALQGQKAKKGIFVTTSSFTKEAQKYAGSIDSKIILIDGGQLAELLMDNGIGVTEAKYGIKKLDSNYFVTHED